MSRPASVRANLHQPQHAIIYYYCDYSDPKTLEAPNIIGALIQQLLLSKAVTEEIGLRIEQVCGLGLREPSEEDLSAILDLVVKMYSTIFIIIDGLDECPTEDQAMALSLVTHLSESEDPSIKVLLFSREEAKIAAACSVFPRLPITTPSVRADVAAFVEEVVSSKVLSGELKIKDPELQRTVISTLIDGAQGMFLWVRFQLEDLCEAASDIEIRATLQHLPNGLTETYTRITEKIRRSLVRWEMAIKVFKWVIFARRPLSKDELAEAIAFNSSDTTWDEAKIPDSLRAVRSCGNLIILDEIDDTVQLAHHTVRQYLLSPDSPCVSLTEVQAEIEIGVTCVTYLSFSDFERQVTEYKGKTEDIGLLQKAVMERMPATTDLGPLSTATWKAFRKLKSPVVPKVKIIKPYQEKRETSPNLQDKYRLLDYAVAYWPSHTSQFSAAQSSIWERFRDLSLGKPVGFDIRPWDGTQCNLEFPHMAMFRWAARNGHEPFLELLLKATKRGTEEIFQHYYRAVSSAPYTRSARRLCGETTPSRTISGGRGRAYVVLVWLCWAWRGGDGVGF
ncbi:MAG: hypothetical protein M1839_008162 [Geoglossum umbratile]|nr:MAG: hypothetical protein M1839_008162 [Geoglossum umbratile]